MKLILPNWLLPQISNRSITPRDPLFTASPYVSMGQSQLKFLSQALMLAELAKVSSMEVKATCWQTDSFQTKESLWPKIFLSLEHSASFPSGSSMTWGGGRSTLHMFRSRAVLLPPPIVLFLCANKWGHYLQMQLFLQFPFACSAQPPHNYWKPKRFGRGGGEWQKKNEGQKKTTQPQPQTALHQLQMSGPSLEAIINLRFIFIGEPSLAWP